MNAKLLTALILALAVPAPGRGAEPDAVPTWRLSARVVAVGLPGVAGVRQVGRFHSGGPIPGNPEFLLSTAAGRVLDPERVLVAVSSNFGASLGDASRSAGSILSIDSARDRTIVVPAGFASSGRPSEAVGGAVRLYTAQSALFQNRRYNSSARTAREAAASGPRYLSINNAFGRPWIANAPNGLLGEGSVTVVDPDGAPLDDAPSGEAGGVFAGNATNRKWMPIAQPSGWIAKALNYRRSGQLTPGSLSTGALGTAFLGASPDGTGFAVFAVVTADGAVFQVHVQDGVDGLAPPGTVGAGAGPDDPGVIGIAFKWDPERVLYVADPAHDRLVLLHLTDDRRHYTVARKSDITLPALNKPVDLAAAMPEIANPSFASHTTLSGGSDLYVANRGDGSLLRLSQDGRMLARAEIDIPGLGVLGRDRLRAIAVSADAQRIWLTLEGELPGFAGHAGALIEVSAFDTGGPFIRPPPADITVSAELLQAGKQAFSREPGGQSIRDEHFVRRVAHMDPVTGRVSSVDHPNSPIARRHSTQEFGRNVPSVALPRQANVSSLRMPLSLYPTSKLDDIPDAVIAAQAVSKGDGIKGRVHVVTSLNGEQRVGRYGWKAHVATLDEMTGEAFANELGISSLLAPLEKGPRPPPEDDGTLVRAVAAYLRVLPPPIKVSP